MAAVNYFRFDGWVKSAQGPAVPGAQIYICTQPANATALPPTPLANVFSDVNGLVPITQPIITDGFGHYDFYATAAVYTIVVGLGGVVQQVYPDQSIGGASGTTGGGGGTALVLQVNGTTSVNQLLANFRGTGTTTVTTDPAGDITINSVASQFSTSGQGFFLGAQSFAPILDDTGHNLNSNGVVYAVQLFLESAWTITGTRCFTVSGNGVTQFVTAGIYSIDGNTKLIDGGKYDTTASQQCRINALSSPVTLPAGSYWFVAAANGTTGGSVLSHNLNTWFTQMVNGISFLTGAVGPVRYGTCANNLVAGVLPATLGTITPLDNTVNVRMPAVMFTV